VTSLPVIGPDWPGNRPLVTDTSNLDLDLDECVGQRQATFRFVLSDAVSGEQLGEIHPIREASLSHDTGSTTKRTLSLSLGKADTADVNALTDRVEPFMVFPNLTNPDHSSGDWPLGKYMWADNPRRVSTGGRLAQPQLTDEMFLVDQQILAGVSGVGLGVTAVLLEVLEGLPITFNLEPSSFTSADSWGVGASRGQILETLSVAGDWWSPWFDNNGVLRFRRTFDPAAAVVDIDLDAGFRVFQDSIMETDELLTAPNTIVVISNNASDSSTPVVGVATVPVNAPNSVPNRGFAIPAVFDLQLSDATQAAAVAQGLAQRQGIFEMVQLSTPPDPRHDSYNVIRWQGSNWLELGWSMPLVEGAAMSHSLRRSYR
jgi:hypothetical protein